MREPWVAYVVVGFVVVSMLFGKYLIAKDGGTKNNKKNNKKDKNDKS